MREIIAAASILIAQPCEAPRVVPQPPAEYRSLDPLTVRLSLGDVQWVNAECIRRLRRQPDPGMVFEACASQSGWMVMRHGALYPGGQGDILAHETGHVRGWYHG